jgi:hypothetical protein
MDDLQLRGELSMQSSGLSLSLGLNHLLRSIASSKNMGSAAHSAGRSSAVCLALFA